MNDNESIILIQGENEKKNSLHYEVNINDVPLGDGGMGRVFRGVMVDENNGSKRPVAVKFLFDDLPQSAIERSIRESSIRIHNDNLIEMIGFVKVNTFNIDGSFSCRMHVISELLEGIMLSDLLKGIVSDKSGNEITFAKQLSFLKQQDNASFAIIVVKSILSGILALHENGYIHRDIDPSNVMVTSNNKIKLIDFGIARKIANLSNQDQLLTTSGKFIGKAAYAAPELAIGDLAHQNKTTDIYAVGILMYQLITGNLPFNGPTLDVLDMQIHKKIPIEIIKDKQLRKIIEKATDKKQEKRYQSAAEFIVALEQYEQSQKSFPTKSYDSNTVRDLLNLSKLYKSSVFPYIVLATVGCVIGLILSLLL